MASRWCFAEITPAKANGKHFMPVFDTKDAGPMVLTSPHYV
jgi:hypothetical protein